MNTSVKYHEMPLPRGIYGSRMAALNACLKAISRSELCVKKVAIFEDPPSAILYILKDLPEKPKRPYSQWLGKFIKTNPKANAYTTLKLNVDNKSSVEKSYTLKCGIERPA